MWKSYSVPQVAEFSTDELQLCNVTNMYCARKMCVQELCRNEVRVQNGACAQQINNAEPKLRKPLTWICLATSNIVTPSYLYCYSSPPPHSHIFAP